MRCLGGPGRCLPWLVVILATARSIASEPLHDGDVIFHTSRSTQSAAIQRATHSPYSHVGLVFHRNGKPFVLEAIATVRYTPLAQWTARGEQGRHVVKRLRMPMTAAQSQALRAAAERYLGKPYDPYFEWSDARIYCSELVWKAYHDALGVDLGTRQRLREFDLRDPAVIHKLRERYGSRIPLDESVISPAAQFNSPLLQVVKSPSGK